MPTCIAPQFRNLKTSRVSKPRGSSRRFCPSVMRSRRFSSDDCGERGAVQEGHVPVRQGRQERMGRGAGSVAGKGDRQHREPLRRADLQREDQAGLRGPQQAELPRQDLQGHHARLQHLPQGEQGGWLPLPKQSCHIVAAVPGAVRSSCRIFRKRSGTSSSSIFCGASTVPASFAVS